MPATAADCTTTEDVWCAALAEVGIGAVKRDDERGRGIRSPLSAEPDPDLLLKALNLARQFIGLKPLNMERFIAAQNNPKAIAYLKGKVYGQGSLFNV